MEVREVGVVIRNGSRVLLCRRPASARWANMWEVPHEVRKDGDLVSGTETQEKVDRAKKMLDAGDVDGAVTELKTLQGGSAEKAQPFIDQAGHDRLLTPPTDDEKVTRTFCGT